MVQGIQGILSELEHTSQAGGIGQGGGTAGVHIGEVGRGVTVTFGISQDGLCVIWIGVHVSGQEQTGAHDGVAVIAVVQVEIDGQGVDGVAGGTSIGVVTAVAQIHEGGG